MDDDVIHAATGDSIMFSAGKRVCSISHFDPDQIAQNSQRLVGIHKGHNNGRCNLWRMTHVSGYRTGKKYIYEKLQSVPVFEVKYELDDEKGRFFIAGNNKYVYSEGTAATRDFILSKSSSPAFLDYPAQCCCICNVPGCFNNCHKCNSCVIL